MLYSGTLYSDGTIYSERIDADNLWVEDKNDIICYIYSNNSKLSGKYYNWYLYRWNATEYVTVDTGLTNQGIIQFNLNDYGLQLQDNTFKLDIELKVIRQILSSSIIKYYYNSHIQQNDLYYEVYVYDIPQGGSSAGIQYVDKHKFPTIKVTKVETNKDKIYINISEIKEEE